MAPPSSDPTPARTPLVSIRGLVKRFGAVAANDRVDLDIFTGEVLALLGENGAGKSTLMRVLYGLYPPDRGEMILDGVPVAFASPKEAMAAGIGMVFQQFSLIPALSILENLLVAWPRAPWWQARSRPVLKQALAWLERLSPGLDPRRAVSGLSVGERQIVELAKALNLEPRLLILDEPTSVLTPAEAERLLGFVRDLAADGKAVVLITHKIADVIRCADRIAIMRRGRLVDEGPVVDRSAEAIVTAMVGQAPSPEVAAAAPVTGKPRLRIIGLSTASATSSCPVSGLSLDVAAGEIVGIAGVLGNGQVALAEAIAGLEPVAAGDILLDDASLMTREGQGSPTALAYIPERPIDNAVVGDLDLADNLNLRFLPRQRLFPSRKEQTNRAARLLRDYDVRPPDPRLPAAALSGGNLQKLVIARELSGEPKLVVACYPAMGLDVRAADAVRQAMFLHARQGAAVLWFSEDLDELLAFAHRIAVLHRGRLMGVMPRTEADRERIGALMIGGKSLHHAA